jgi:hypothetical protein
MKYFAIFDIANRVQLIVSAEMEPAPEDVAEHAYTELIDWAGEPTRPPGDAELMIGGAIVYWLDTRTLEQVRAARWIALKAHRTALDYAPISVDGIELDTADASRMDFMGAIMSMQITGQSSRTWRCSDNIMRSLTLTQIMAAGIGIADRRSALIKTSDLLYQQINAALTDAEVLAVEWPAEH